MSSDVSKETATSTSISYSYSSYYSNFTTSYTSSSDVSKETATPTPTATSTNTITPTITDTPCANPCGKGCCTDPEAPKCAEPNLIICCANNEVYTKQDGCCLSTKASKDFNKCCPDDHSPTNDNTCCPTKNFFDGICCPNGKDENGGCLATPTPTDTPLPPTNTPVPPTDMPLPPTNTPCQDGQIQCGIGCCLDGKCTSSGECCNDNQNKINDICVNFTPTNIPTPTKTPCPNSESTCGNGCCQSGRCIDSRECCSDDIGEIINGICCLKEQVYKNAQGKDDCCPRKTDNGFCCEEGKSACGNIGCCKNGNCINNQICCPDNSSPVNGSCKVTCQNCCDQDYEEEYITTTLVNNFWVQYTSCCPKGKIINENNTKKCNTECNTSGETSKVVATYCKDSTHYHTVESCCKTDNWEFDKTINFTCQGINIGEVKLYKCNSPSSSESTSQHS